MKIFYEYVSIESSWGDVAWICLHTKKAGRLRDALKKFHGIYSTPEISVLSELTEYLRFNCEENGEDPDAFLHTGYFSKNPEWPMNGYVLKLRYLGGKLASMSGKLPRRKDRLPDGFEAARRQRQGYHVGGEL